MSNNETIIAGMVDGYLECQLWAGLNYTDEGSEPTPYDDDYSREDIADEYVDSVREEFTALVALHPLAVRMYLNRVTVMGNMRNVHTPEQFGHDYYLTREHHGAGFWDRGLGELGDYLTDIATHAGGADQLWDNGDGKLHAE